MPASKGWIGRRDRLMAQTPDSGPGAGRAARPAPRMLWTSPADRPAPCGTRGQPVDNAHALPAACPHSQASRPQNPQRPPPDLPDPIEHVYWSIRQHPFNSRLHLKSAAYLSKDWSPPLKKLDASFRKNIQETIAQSLQYVRKCRDPRAPHWFPGHFQHGEGLRSFFCGGGVRSDFYGRILHEFQCKPPALRLRSVRLEKPEDMKMPSGSVGHEDGYARLAVAYGLSQDPCNIGVIKPMNKIEDEHLAAPREDSGSEYVGKEMV